MNISSSVGQSSTSSVNANPNAPIKNSVRSVEPVVGSEIEQAQSSNKQAKPSFVIDEQAIALFEKNQAEQSQASIATKAQTRNDSYYSENQDQPLAKSEMAVANYQAVGNLAQRESVQKLFGVDLFA